MLARFARGGYDGGHDTPGHPFKRASAKLSRLPSLHGRGNGKACSLVAGRSTKRCGTGLAGLKEAFVSSGPNRSIA